MIGSFSNFFRSWLIFGTGLPNFSMFLLACLAAFLSTLYSDVYFFSAVKPVPSLNIS